MKKIILYLLLISGFADVFGQTDSRGNPVFNSKLISEEKFDGFELTTGYYTIDNNISNKSSSVFVSENPTNQEYLNFSRNLPSYFFLVRKDMEIKHMIILLPKIEGTKTKLFYNIVNPSSGKNVQLDCEVWGEISEYRTNELLNLKIDTSAIIIDLPNDSKGLVYEGIVYKIQLYNKLKEEVIKIASELIEIEKFSKDPKQYIKKESIGGSFDFTKILEKEKGELFIGGDIAYNKKEFAIYLWGRNVKAIGIKDEDDAIDLWEEIYKRQLTETEEKALLNGFNSKKD